jgi:hypothetical protein
MTRVPLLKLSVANMDSGEVVGVPYINSVSIKAIKGVITRWVNHGAAVEDIMIHEADQTDNNVKFIIEEFLKRLEKHIDSKQVV